MNTFDVWSMSLPFRKWEIDRITQKFYSEYFHDINGGNVFEIGCGHGAGAEIILKYFSPENIISTDLDPRMVNSARKKVHRPEITFEEANSAKLKYSDSSFDAVFVYGVLHHIPSPDWKLSLSEVYRVLKTRGTVFIYDLSIESFETIFGKIIRYTTPHPYSQMYKKVEFTSCLKEVGFTIIKQVDLSGFPLKYFVMVAQKV